MKTRKPNMKDKVIGVSELLKELIIDFFDMNFAHVKLNWMLIKSTIKGEFEIAEE
jgi:hypothetical protein